MPLVGVARAKELIFSGRTVGADEAGAIGLLARTATPGEAEAAAIALAGELAEMPSEGLRRLKAMFREFERTADRVGRENDLLIEWQLHGAGLPAGRIDT